MKKITFLILIGLIMSGCVPSAPVPITETIDPLTPLEKARVTLTAYLDALNQGAYERAAEDFGGDPDLLAAYNPDRDQKDITKLLEAACELNGFQCLPLRSILKEEALSDTEFLFTVQFVNENGEIFEIGACCGEDPENVVPVSEFDFLVELQGEDYRVVSLPPYIP